MGDSINRWQYKKEVRKVIGPFDDANASIIVKVAEGSPAEQVDLREGDFVIQLDGRPVLNQEQLDSTWDVKERKYLFYSHRDHSYMDVVMESVPLGIVTEPSSKYLLKELMGGEFPGWEGFRLLWKRRDWKKLYQASEAVYSESAVFRLIRKVIKDFGGNAGLLYKGAALFETGQEAEGITLISRFINNHISSYETYEHAIAYYYAAKWAEFVGDNQEVEHWLLESDRSNDGEFDRISQEVYLKGFESFSGRYRWIGRTFPCNYTLAKLSGSGSASLSDSLSILTDGQLLPVCVMPSYRGNAPYNDAMGCYGSIYRYIDNKIMPMQIIIDALEKIKGEEWRYENEENIFRNGIPFEMLYDPERSVSEALNLEFSPVFYLLNKDGVVVYEGPLRRAFDYWAVLASRAQES